MRKLFLLAFLLTLVLIPGALGALADNTHSVQTDMEAFVGAFQQAFRGHWEASVSLLFESIPLFALIIIVYGLVYYVAAISLFKEPDHHKYARMIALGIALIGIVQQKVYDWVMSISTTFVMVMFVIVIIFMLLMSLRHMRTQNAKLGKKFYKAKNKELSAKRELTELKHEVRMDKAENKHVWNSLRDLDTDLQHMSRLEGTILHQIDQLLGLTGKAYAAQKSEDGSKTLHGYARALTTGVHTLASTMRKQETYDNKLKEIIARLQHEIKQWDHLSNQEQGVDHSFEQIMRKVLKGRDFQGHKAHDIMNADAHIRSNINLLHEYVRELKTLDNHMNHLSNRVNTHIDNKTEHAVDKIQGHIASHEFAQAQQFLGNLRRLIEEDEVIIKELEALDVQAKHLLKNISTVERQLETEIPVVIRRLTSQG